MWYDVEVVGRLSVVPGDWSEGTPPGPTMDTALGCGTTREGWVACRLCLVISRSGPCLSPTMGTASGCGTTVGVWVPDWGAVRRRGLGGVVVVAARWSCSAMLTA